MRFDELKYPTSMSSYLYGPNDEILTKDRGLVVIKRFRFEMRYVAVFYSLVPSLPSRDIGQQINTEIETCGGDGIVNVKISSNLGFTTYLHPLTLLPFWPSYTTVVVEGDIVKYEPSTSQSAPKTAAFDITDDVLITEITGESVHLNEQCHVIGKIDTLSAKDPAEGSSWRSFSPTKSQTWRIMRPLDRDESEQTKTMQDRVKIAARERGANVAQILYVDNRHEENANLKPPRIGAVLYIRYWSCPTNHSQ